VRTAAEGASEEELERDVNRLKAQWEVIEKKVEAGSAPQQLYAEPDLTLRIVRDLFTEDFKAAHRRGQRRGPTTPTTPSRATSTPRRAAPGRAAAKLGPPTEGDLFAKFRIDEQVAKALERKVFLPSAAR
jgi:ribonuclease E